MAVLAILVGGCAAFPGGGTGVRASGEIELTRDQPSVAVEFEVNLTRLDDASKFFVQFYAITPREPRDRPGTLPDGHRRELWDGTEWVPYEEPQEVAERGINTFEVRWVFTMAPVESEVSVKYELEINPCWCDGETVPREGRDYEDLSVAVTAVYPTEDY